MPEETQPTLPDPGPVAPREAPAPSDPGRAARLGRYDVLFELARGGMGSVHVGRLRGAHGFGRLVAVKRIHRVDDTTSMLGLLDEARLTGRLHHPNVVQTLELDEADGEPFLVMQLVQGVSLARLLAALAREGRAVPPRPASRPSSWGRWPRACTPRTSSRATTAGPSGSSTATCRRTTCC